MADPASHQSYSLKENLMRFAPPAAALALMLALTASAGMGQVVTREPDPRALAIVAEGRAALAAGDTQDAIDAFEAALVIDPSINAIYLDLAEAARADGLPGKAIGYYRDALARDPENIAAIAGEGEALAEKGALTAARDSLTELQSRCGAGCAEAAALAAAIERGPRVLTAEALVPDTGVTQN